MSATMGTRGFVLLWSAQLVSIVGSALTGFVLGVWTYERSGSATQFALIMLSGAIPALLIAPFAGALADRMHRRWLLAGADCVAFVSVGVLALLIHFDLLQNWHVYAVTALTAMCGTLQQVTFSAMIPLLVPKQHLSRANGLSQVVFSAQIAAPVVAGTLLALTGLQGVVLIDVFTFGASLLVVLLVPLPRAAVRTADPEPGAPSIWRQVPDGWAELRRRPGLTGLLGVLAGFYFCFGIAGTLVRPLVLSFASPAGLGFQVFAGGCGLFAGSLVMGVWGGPKKRMRGISLFMVFGGIALAAHSLAPSLALVIAIGPFFLFTLPVITGTAQTLLQSKVDPANLGKVMATSRAVSQAASPVAYLVAGPLADGVFGPLMRPDGALAGSAGRLIGTGPGRGMALMFLLAGVLLVVLGLLASRRSLRRVEELPDLLADDSEDSDGSGSSDGSGDTGGSGDGSDSAAAVAVAAAAAVVDSSAAVAAADAAVADSAAAVATIDATVADSATAVATADVAIADSSAAAAHTRPVPGAAAIAVAESAAAVPDDTVPDAAEPEPAPALASRKESGK